MSELKKLASRLMTLDDKLIFCMKCGNCQAVCPMFGATHMEADVARGKLALIGNLAHEVIRDPEAVADKLGRCLLCGSCQANCPSGVRIMDIFMEARELVYAYLGLNPVKKMIFRILLAKPDLFNFTMRVGAELKVARHLALGAQLSAFTMSMKKPENIELKKDEFYGIEQVGLQVGLRHYF